MKIDDRELYQKAFDLKKVERFEDSISEFKRIIQDHGDPANICPVMIAILYAYEMEDYGSALPFAKEAVAINPANEKISLCLTHCYVDANRQNDANDEIRRYLATGGEVYFYQTFFDETELSVEDFT